MSYHPPSSPYVVLMSILWLFVCSVCSSKTDTRITIPCGLLILFKTFSSRFSLLSISRSMPIVRVDHLCFFFFFTPAIGLRRHMFSALSWFLLIFTQRHSFYCTGLFSFVCNLNVYNLVANPVLSFPPLAHLVCFKSAGCPFD